MNCNSSFNKDDLGRLGADTLEKTNRHPCYSFDAHHKYARMHLPVAPACNISCNYCNRKFDCVNESRPGVTGEVLTPVRALEKFNHVREKVENLSVVGIAGPGDALANWDSVRETIELIKDTDSDVVFCLSTNGLMLPDYAPEIISLGVRHVTVTLNALDPQTGSRIYKYVNREGKRYQGSLGAEVLKVNQLDGIEYLARHGVAVKVNIVMIKDINDREIPGIVQKVRDLGAFMTNIMPLIPAPESAFENYPQTSMKELNKMRDICQADLPQMRHCRQCRADAIGLLGEDRSREFDSFECQAVSPVSPATLASAPPAAAVSTGKKYRIAVASKYDLLVDLHFGHTSEFSIYEGDGETFRIVEKRQVEKYCMGMDECDTEESKREAIIQSLKDCNAVLTIRIGYHAKKRLAKSGIISVETCDTVEAGLAQTVKVLCKKNQEIA